MRLFGDILPFIGFRRVSWDEVRERGLVPYLDEEGCDYEMFEVEWLGHGFTLFGRPVFELES